MWQDQTPGLPVERERMALKWQGDSFDQTSVDVAVEYALTIHVNDHELATIVCTPDHLEDLVLGFLASEGIIRAADQVQQLVVQRLRGVVRVRTDGTHNFNQSFFNKRYIGSCCGKGRQSFYFYNDAQTARRVDDDVRFSPDMVTTLMSRVEADALLHHRTGGVHTAALCRGEDILVSRVDIGRHNALDKLYGHVLTNKLPLPGTVIAFSGRLSSEVLLKVAKIGVGLVFAKSAPTALALDMAEQLNITTVGFARAGEFNVYTHAWRFNASIRTSTRP